MAEARVAALREQEAGNAAVGRRDWAEAHERYTASLALHPTAAAHSNRAAARLALDRAAEALEDARAALELEPAFLRAYVRASAAHRALGDDAAALAAAREGLAIAVRTSSPLVPQLREAEAAASGAPAQRLERTSEEARTHFRVACGHCGTVLQTTHMCRRCRQVAYCNDTCAGAAWPAHRAACKVMAASLASASAEAGMARLPVTSQSAALQNWAADNLAHWMALQALAWHVQHSPPAAWGAPGAVAVVVMRGATDAATLRVQLSPLALLRRGGALPFQDVDLSLQTTGFQDMLSRVDVDVGFLAAVNDRSAANALSMGRVRYNASADMLATQVTELLNARLMRVHAEELRAEVDVALFHELVRRVGAMPRA